MHINETITNYNDRGDDVDEDSNEDCEVDEEESYDNEFEETYYDYKNNDDLDNDEFISGHLSDVWLFLFGYCNYPFETLLVYILFR